MQPFLDGRALVSVHLLAEGKSNTNYKIELNDGNAYVLRLYGRAQPDWECAVMRLVAGVVPVPSVLYRSDRWAIFSFLPGKPLREVPQFAGEAAKALARIAAVPFDRPGQLNTDGSVTPWPFGGLRGFMDQMLGDERVVRWIGWKRIGRIAAVLERETDRIAELDAESRLVHGDFNPGNILIHNGEVSGVLDWEFAFAGTPFVDIGNLLRNLDEQHHDALLTGLQLGGIDLPPDWKERAALVDLSSHLEFLISNRADGFKELCVLRIERFLSQFG
ncbi:MAG: phosphotransferase family protein [Anaerolineae bacterium]